MIRMDIRELRSGSVGGLNRTPREPLLIRFFLPMPACRTCGLRHRANGKPYDATEPPVIFGHYWLPIGWPLDPLMPNVICVDYSAGKGGPLVAYSFDSERAREGEFTSAE